MTRTIITAALILVLLGGLTTSTARAAFTTVDRVDLAPIHPDVLSPAEITRDAAGNLIVSDSGGLIWKINPVSGAYTLYNTGLLQLSYATSITGGYWYTDFGSIIGFTDMTNTYYWQVPLFSGQSTHNLGSIAQDSSGQVWVIEYEDLGSKIYRLSRSGDKLTVCMLKDAADSFSTYAYHLTYYGGYLYWYNWFQDQIARLNPVAASGSYMLESWSTMRESYIAEGIANDFDAQGNLWISGGGDGTILRFTPSTRNLITYLTPIADSSIDGVTIIGTDAWFVDFYGSVGKLDLNMPGPTPQQLDPPVLTQLTETCSAPLTATTDTVAVQSGNLPFGSLSISPDTSAPGWTIYPIGIEDRLDGINSAQGVVIISQPVTTNGSSTSLLRFREVLGDQKVFLPLITR